MGGSGGAEGREHHRSGDRPVRSHRQRIAGAVVEPGQDLDVGAYLDASDAAAAGEVAGAIGESVVGDVGLPALVGLLSLEPHVTALRTLRGLWCDHAGPDQNPVDRGPGQAGVVMVGEVPADRVSASVQASLGQLLAELQDQLDGLTRGRARAGPGCPGQRLERCLAHLSVAGHELADPALRHAVGPGNLGLGPAGQDCSDHEATFRHS